MEEITLCVQGEVFQVKKQYLCKYSDYFRAMFSGRYVEDQLSEIFIGVVDAHYMSIVLQFMKSGAIDLRKHSLGTIDDIAATAEYLMVNDLMKDIAQTLYEMDLCESTWMQVMAIAECYSFPNVEQVSAAYGLYSFRSMRAEHIPTIHKLAWYLSHPYLDSQSEMDVFNFGFQWVLNNEADADALLVVLSCLDYTRLAHQDILDIRNCIRQEGFVNSVAAAVVDCLYEMSNNKLPISLSVMNKHRSELCDKFTERVWTETRAVVEEDNSRLLKYTPVVPSYSYNSNRRYIYQALDQDGGFEELFNISESIYRINATSWGTMKVVVLYHYDEGNQKGILNKVKVYDLLRKKWIYHNVVIPLCKYLSIVVINDLLYIVGGTIHKYKRLVTEVTVYDLITKKYKKIANLPESSLAVICSHNNKLYAAQKCNIYCYVGTGKSGLWESVARSNRLNISCITSYKNYIYCLQNNNPKIYRFQPHVDDKIKEVMFFKSYQGFLINAGNSLLVFTRRLRKSGFALLAELKEDNQMIKSNIIHKYTNYNSREKLVRAGAFAVVTTLPPLQKQLSEYKRVPVEHI